MVLIVPRTLELSNLHEEIAWLCIVEIHPGAVGKSRLAAHWASSVYSLAPTRVFNVNCHLMLTVISIYLFVWTLIMETCLPLPPEKTKQ